MGIISGVIARTARLVICAARGAWEATIVGPDLDEVGGHGGCPPDMSSTNTAPGGTVAVPGSTTLIS